MEKWKDLCLEVEQFDQDFFQQFSSEAKDFSSAKLDNVKATRGRDLIFGNWVVRFAEIYSSIRDFTVTAGTKFVDLNVAVSKGQEKVIALQEELICRKDEQLAALQSTVKAEVAGVQTAVKTEIGSWSKVVQQSTANAAHISPARIKEAVKSAVAEDDRSRNVIIFGKKEEEDNETVSDTATAVFQDLNEKPRIVECRRIGTISHGKCRPIKVKLSSSEAVLHILRNAKTLKTSINNSSTYIAQDRTKEERAQHKDLVAKVRAKMDSEPRMYHFIRGGAVVTVKKKS